MFLRVTIDLEFVDIGGHQYLTDDKYAVERAIAGITAAFAEIDIWAVRKELKESALDASTRLLKCAVEGSPTSTLERINNRFGWCKVEEVNQLIK